MTAPAPTPTPPTAEPSSGPAQTAPAAQPNQQPTPAPLPPAEPAPAPQQQPPKLKQLSLAVDESLGIPNGPYGELIYEIALRHAINPHLVAALIHVESAFNPRAVSRKGARGLMQLLPATARRFGLTKKGDLFDPGKNVEAGVRYLKWLTERFGGDVQRVLAAYNAGEGAVDRFGGIPPYRETQNYVRKIFGLLGIPQTEPLSPPAPAATAESLGGVAAGGR